MGQAACERLLGQTACQLLAEIIRCASEFAVAFVDDLQKCRIHRVIRVCGTVEENPCTLCSVIRFGRGLRFHVRRRVAATCCLWWLDTGRSNRRASRQAGSRFLVPDLRKFDCCMQCSGVADDPGFSRYRIHDNRPCELALDRPWRYLASILRGARCFRNMFRLCRNRTLDCTQSVHR